jgi:polyhydroxybutyrate depolymerase
MKISFIAAGAGIALLGFACSADDPNDPIGGAGVATGGSASAGSPATGGSNANVSGTSVGGGSAGSGTNTSGTSTGGMAGAASGGSGGSATAGSAAGGAAGMGGSAGGSGGTGGGGNNAAAKPSAGCSKAAAADVATADHIYRIPSTGYDGKKPFPLLIGFHAASNPIEQIQNLTKGSDFDKNYVRYFPKSAGTQWNYSSDIAKVVTMYEDLIANYCIDLNRVFATGHSSGAQFITQLVTTKNKTNGDKFKFKGVAPVAADPYGAIAGPIPVMYIQGKMDNVRGNDGSATVALFRTANACGSTSKPYTNAPACMSGNTAVNNGCVQYDGCMAPTVWCSHNDPAYSNTNHGWPCFATKAMYDFFASLP